MTFQTLKQQFHDGLVNKPDFIAQALQQHQALFEYVAVTRSTDVREIHISAEGVRFRVAEPGQGDAGQGTAGVWLHCPPDEARVAPIEVMNFDHYEPDETRVMDRLAAGARQILDVGANIGWYAVRFAQRQPQAQVHAFEPMPTAYAYLQRNVAANGVAGRVAVYNHGLSDTSGAVNFFISPRSGTNASLLNVAAAQDARSVVGLTLTLDDWVANHGIAPDFIKCDVEGAELLVMRGGGQTLTRHKPIIFAELLRKWSLPFGYHPNDMLGTLADLGYRCWAVGPNGVRRIEWVTDDTVETNYAFLHAQHHAALIAQLSTLQPGAGHDAR